MKKISPFMLVRQVNLLENNPASLNSAAGKGARKLVKSMPVPSAEAQAHSTVRTILSSSPLLSRTFEALNPALKQTLIDAYRGVSVSKAPARTARHKAGGTSKKKAAAKSKATVRWLTTGTSNKNLAKVSGTNVAGATYVEEITRSLSRAVDPLRIGILDLGAWIAGLPNLLVRLNASQELVTLFEVNAPVPSGLRKTAVGTAEWITSHQVKLGRTQRKDLEPHVVFEDFFLAASDIRTSLGLDMVVGLVPVMVAGEDGDSIYWNHFSNVQDRVVLISTTDVREFAKKAGRPFEAAVGGMIIGAILIGFNDRLSYHDETRGCLFDYNEGRSSIVDAIRAAKLCPACAELLTVKQQAATESMLKVLRQMKRSKP